MRSLPSLSVFVLLGSLVRSIGATVRERDHTPGAGWQKADSSLDNGFQCGCTTITYTSTGAWVWLPSTSSEGSSGWAGQLSGVATSAGVAAAASWPAFGFGSSPASGWVDSSSSAAPSLPPVPYSGSGWAWDGSSPASQSSPTSSSTPSSNSWPDSSTGGPWSFPTQPTTSSSPTDADPGSSPVGSGPWTSSTNSATWTSPSGQSSSYPTIWSLTSSSNSCGPPETIYVTVSVTTTETIDKYTISTDYITSLSTTTTTTTTESDTTTTSPTTTTTTTTSDTTTTTTTTSESTTTTTTTTTTTSPTTTTTTTTSPTTTTTTTTSESTTTTTTTTTSESTTTTTTTTTTADFCPPTVTPGVQPGDGTCGCEYNVVCGEEIVSAEVLAIVTEGTFASCLSLCDTTTDCNSVGYDETSDTCTLYSDSDPTQIANPSMIAAIFDPDFFCPGPCFPPP